MGTPLQICGICAKLQLHLIPLVYVLYIPNPPAICWLLRKPMRPKYYLIRKGRYLCPELQAQAEESRHSATSRGLKNRLV